MARHGMARQGRARIMDNNNLTKEIIMTKSTLFFGGIPTDIDVEAIIKETGPLQDGDIISYKKISEIIKQPITSHRFKTVTGAWRRRLNRNYNQVIKAKGGEFKVMTNHDRVDHVSGKYKGALRIMGRATNTAARTSREGLSKEEVKALDHVQNTGAALRLSAATAAKQLKYPG
jgi:hypothetical protein